MLSAATDCLLASFFAWLYAFTAALELEKNAAK
jgi:hypothetical protein